MYLNKLFINDLWRIHGLWKIHYVHVVTYFLRFERRKHLKWNINSLGLSGSYFILFTTTGDTSFSFDLSLQTSRSHFSTKYYSLFHKIFLQKGL